MTKMTKRKLCVMVAIALIFSLFPQTGSFASANHAARTISIFEVSGDVHMTRGTAREFSARAGVSLFNGHTVRTGRNSSAHLRLDDNTLLKMDQSSKIEISTLRRNRLSISVLSGSLAVDAVPQGGNDTVEVRAGSSALAIRGTFFIAEFTGDGSSRFTMFEGSGESGGHTLPARHIMYITDGNIVAGGGQQATGEPQAAGGAEDGKTYTIVPFELNEGTSAFTLATVLGDTERFINNGIIAEADILGWDFDEIWQWDSTRNLPTLRDIGATQVGTTSTAAGFNAFEVGEFSERLERSGRFEDIIDERNDGFSGTAFYTTDGHIFELLYPEFGYITMVDRAVDINVASDVRTVTISSGLSSGQTASINHQRAVLRTDASDADVFTVTVDTQGQAGGKVEFDIIIHEPGRPGIIYTISINLV